MSDTDVYVQLGNLPSYVDKINVVAVVGGIVRSVGWENKPYIEPQGLSKVIVKYKTRSVASQRIEISNNTKPTHNLASKAQAGYIVFIQDFVKPTSAALYWAEKVVAGTDVFVNVFIFIFHQMGKNFVAVCEETNIRPRIFRVRTLECNTE